MKKLLKILLVLVVIIAVVIIGAATYVSTALPDVGEAPDMKVEITPEKVERGRYLANSVAICSDCHSLRDSSKFAMPNHGPMFAGSGGDFTREFGFPGDYYAPNLTPAHLGNWTDGEIYRAITMGVSKDGRALFELMPYKHYGQMAKSDIEAIIAYLRTLEPVERSVPVSEPDFPLNFIINTMPQKPQHQPIPEKTNAVKYGEYLTNAAACIDCHTPRVDGQLNMELPFAGGQGFPIHQGIVFSANITPSENGIGSMSREAFINRFKQHETGETATPVGENEFNTIMPWHTYSRMNEEDISAIYSYLRSLAPLDNKVTRFKTYAEAKKE